MTRRLHELDALRGFAVCGIMVVNTWQHTRGQLRAPERNAVDWVIENLFQSRFYPIFSFLFGLSFVLFLRSAAERTDRPRLVLLRRLAVLGCLGFLHQTVNPGEVLLPYAIFGALVLLPASFAPRAGVLALGIAATAWGVREGGGIILVPGLFLLGMAMMGYAPPERLLLPAFLVGTVLAVSLGCLWVRAKGGDLSLYFRGVYPAAGLAAATAYCTGLLLLLRTGAREALLAALSPLGRMALTNYLLSSVVILAALPLLTADPTRVSGIALSVAVLAAQAVFSRMWLERFRYGPLEWAWRCLTWMERVPNSRIRSNV
ncbi:DUF418 domain-containing protein [Streptosporangium carneum]|uniref:DUF418 domain-containing protein n=1 Tax=Streptosporangium carneum TaxID=47481 RepID=UPI0022F2E6DB|nr:DUF418 domain-containing protein [Streptosporangium carneum]